MANNVCRTCLMRYDANNPQTFRSLQDYIYHGMIKIKLIDVLVFLNCVDIDVEEKWPRAMCATCVTAATEAFTFKRRCIEANEMLTRHAQSPPMNHEGARRGNLVYLDHQYDSPIYSQPYPVDIDCRLA